MPSIEDAEMNATEFVFLAVQDGLLEVRQDGSVWRIARRRVDKWSKRESVAPIEPRRADENLANGYRLVRATRNSRTAGIGAHRLVYRAIHGPIPPGLTINHKNGVRADNHPDNLELATYAEQSQHAIHVLGKSRSGESNGRARLNRKQVEEIRRRLAAGETGRAIASDFGITEHAVSHIACGKSWKEVPSAQY
jgi:hypothetical protein